jgi:hypothetical protein
LEACPEKTLVVQRASAAVKQNGVGTHGDEVDINEVDINELLLAMKLRLAIAMKYLSSDAWGPYVSCLVEGASVMTRAFLPDLRTWETYSERGSVGLAMPTLVVKRGVLSLLIMPLLPESTGIVGGSIARGAHE